MQQPPSRKPLPGDALEAFRILVTRQFEVLLKKEKGVVEGRDIEYLHDFRVAVRRIRALVGQMKGVLPPDLFARLRSEFAWMGQVTGRPRDLDVLHSQLFEYHEATGVRDPAELEPIVARIEEHRRIAREGMLAQMATERYAALFVEVRAFLRLESLEAAPGEGDADSGPEATLEVARRRIRKIWRKFHRKATRVTGETTDAELHELRILGKKLRYLLEFFQDLFPPLAVDPLVSSLKRCQDVLGEIQDCVVHGKDLEALAVEIWERGVADPAGILTLGRMLQHLHARRLVQRDAVPAAAQEVLEQDLNLRLLLEG